jgi:hypothetical protein
MILLTPVAVAMTRKWLVGDEDDEDIIAKGVICDNMIYSLPFGSNFT